MKKFFLAVLAVTGILVFNNISFSAETAPVEVKKDVPSSAVAAVPAAAPVSISTGTELKISELKCDMGTGECVITWKTNIDPKAKAKIAFWSSDQPNIEDKTFVEPAASSGLDHKFVIRSADVPAAFFKVRLSYAISEDAGAYSDVPAKDIIKVAEPVK